MTLVSQNALRRCAIVLGTLGALALVGCGSKQVKVEEEAATPEVQQMQDLDKQMFQQQIEQNKQMRQESEQQAPSQPQQ